jgi:hypothetical protein
MNTIISKEKLYRLNISFNIVFIIFIAVLFFISIQYHALLL